MKKYVDDDLEEDNPKDGPGLIDLDMKDFGRGTMNDPLRHAFGLRTAQDQQKMRMWNGFPGFFQNTIFHGEQDAEIKALRSHGSVKDRLARSRHLKDLGTQSLKSATCDSSPVSTDEPPEEDDSERRRLEEHAKRLEGDILAKEQELKALRRELVGVKAKLEAVPQVVRGEKSEAAGHCIDNNKGHGQKEALEEAIRNYEKAAGLLRYVECTRPDWKNEDGSYKGIDDQTLRVDTLAIDGDDEAAKAAKDLVVSCYLNIALAYFKLCDFEKMLQACDEVLTHLSPKCVKALYRRAQARVALPRGLDSDLDLAIRDLQTAAHLAPQDKDVRGFLETLRSKKRSQELNERSAFAGLFDRGQLVTNDPKQEGDKPAKLDINDPKVQRMLDIHPGPGGFKGL